MSITSDGAKFDFRIAISKEFDQSEEMMKAYLPSGYSFSREKVFFLYLF